MSAAPALIETRWRELAAAAFTASGGSISAELARLVAAYSQAGRHYHGLAHIAALLALSATHRSALADPLAVDLAIYYHDAVYDPARHDNEAASADLARASLQTLGAKETLIGKVAAYIEATLHVGPTATAVTPNDGDLDHLLDFDLSILAAAPSDYDAYASAIRREYTIYPDAAYVQGRAGVLRKLLALPALYRVPAFAAAWQPRATANLERELASLPR